MDLLPLGPVLSLPLLWLVWWAPGPWTWLALHLLSYWGVWGWTFVGWLRPSSEHPSEWLGLTAISVVFLLSTLEPIAPSTPLASLVPLYGDPHPFHSLADHLRWAYTMLTLRWLLDGVRGLARALKVESPLTERLLSVPLRGFLYNGLELKDGREMLRFLVYAGVVTPWWFEGIPWRGGLRASLVFLLLHLLIHTPHGPQVLIVIGAQLMVLPLLARPCTRAFWWRTFATGLTLMVLSGMKSLPPYLLLYLCDVALNALPPTAPSTATIMGEAVDLTIPVVVGVLNIVRHTLIP